MLTKILNAEITEQVQEVFNQLVNPVAVIFFGDKENCEYCEDTLQLMQEVVGLSDKLQLTTYDIHEEPGIAQQYNVDKTPGIVIAGLEGEQILDYGIRFAGIPSGHEFSSLINDLLMVSSRDSGLQTQTRDYLAQLKKPMLLQVFVTPSCPYCSRAVILAHQMALESSMVEAEMVEAIEFPELSQRYGVSGVPQTTINDGAGMVVGAYPEDHLLAEIQRVLS